MRPLPKKINLISCGSMIHVSDIKLIRTDTTLDLSQKAEKALICVVGFLHWQCGTLLGSIVDVCSHLFLKLMIKLSRNCRALPKREPFQKFSKAKAEPRPKRGFGNSFQPAIDAPRLLPH
ncbi:hypothetical protein ACOSP7_020582 [Xanthoceras sorbifolium]